MSGADLCLKGGEDVMLRILMLCLLASPAWVFAAEAPAEVDGAMTINVYQARQLHALGAVFIDVRPRREWSWGHVEGAVHMNLAREFIGLSRTEWPRSVPLVVYCDSEVCPASAEAVRLAVEWGYQQVFYFREGYFAWMLADFPQEKDQIDDIATLNAQAH
ncbi:Rhodanese-related sulfurtransferase [Stutzerimonas xanthomarina]|uniref:Rhodanese-related sulfurtransferase n=3 Tax=Stutzerimonas xanthomarina TaxID=271420 RepID=A0A1M5RGW2_9GAMM|nr:Rhodanese-related sulfurtransferase [Stutzerimonas xanthomarina]SHH25289.1 Rhodanese-related sulfurtransferase [Stutzerimonas xanthomarina DSM 18231]